MRSENVNMSKLYEFRKIIHQLYKTNFQNRFDLNEKIFSLMEDDTLKIESISGSVEEMSFKITSSEESIYDTTKILDRINKLIKRYIDENYDYLDLSSVDKNEFEIWIDNYSNFYDYSYFKNIILINL